MRGAEKRVKGIWGGRKDRLPHPAPKYFPLLLCNVDPHNNEIRLQESSYSLIKFLSFLQVIRLCMSDVFKRSR